MCFLLKVDVDLTSRRATNQVRQRNQIPTELYNHPTNDHAYLTHYGLNAGNAENNHLFRVAVQHVLGNCKIPL